MKSYESSTATLRAILSHPSLQRERIDETMDAMASANADAKDIDDAIRIGAAVAQADAGVDETKLVRKLDLYLIWLVMSLYAFSFLDRVNIGNARLYGLEEDLGMKGDQFQIAVSILFVTYILSELPSNLVIKKFTPRIWLCFLTTSWGIVATLTGVVQSYAGLLVCRLVLGALEGMSDS